MPTGNHLQFGPDGKAKFKSGKALFAPDGTPCCCTTPCSFCDSHGTPNTVKVVLAGWSVVNTCSVCSATTSGKINSYNINGTYCLPYCNPCAWADSFDGLIDVDFWSGNNSCTGARTENYTRLLMQLYRTSGGFGHAAEWNLALYPGKAVAGCNDECVYATVSTNCGGGALCFLSRAGPDQENDCTIAMALTAGGGGAGITVGTINITPNGC